MESVLIFATIIAPIIVALIELVKRSFNVDKKILPVLALAIGLFIGVISYPFTELDTILRIWAGGIAGLASVGLFEIGDKRKSNDNITE